MRYAARAQPLDWPDPTVPSTLQITAPQPAPPQRVTPPLDATAIEHLVVAVREAVPNAVTHGGPPVGFRLWSASDASWPPSATAVTDLRPVRRSPARLRYLRGRVGSVAHPPALQPVTLDTTNAGFTIGLVVGTPQLGRSGHASDTA